jgi:hypothetical protein
MANGIVIPSAMNCCIPNTGTKSLPQFRKIDDTTLNNNTFLWVVSDVDGNLYRPTIAQLKTLTSGAVVASQKPIIGVAGRGQLGDPIVGTSTYSNTKLAGLGSFIAIIDGLIWQNFGNYGNQFTFNTNTGTITFSNFTWQSGMSIYVNMNQ